MPFEVVKVFKDDVDKVQLQGEDGPIIGMWQNSMEFPILMAGSTYQVELIILDEDEIIYLSQPKGHFRSRIEDDHMVFTGLIENIYEDGSADLRLSQDMLLLLNKKKELWKLNHWVTFTVPFDRVLIFPYFLNTEKKKFVEL